MTSPHYRILLVALTLIALSWLLIAFLNIEAIEHIGIGIVLGLLFGHATLAAGWTAFGPGPLLVRLPLSLVWLAGCVLAFTINVFWYGGGPDLAFATVFSVCLLAQWMIVQAILWALAIGYGWRLRHKHATHQGGSYRERQFGIRQLMILTAIVAVVLGIGRLVITNLPATIDSGRDTVILIFLGVAAIVMTLPLLLAALLHRYWLPAVLVTSLLVALATAFELPLLNQFIAGAGGGPDALHLIYINLFTSLWILVFVLAVRLCGYGISGLSAKEPPASAPS